MITTKELKQLSHICAYCGKVLTMDERTNDHIVPKSAGGKVKISNIVVCCSNCNRIKNT